MSGGQDQESVRRLGVLGGSFNPIHFGHLEMAQAAHEQYCIPEILLCPTSDTYYKSASELLPADIRCEMVSKAIGPFPYMKLSTIDVDRGGYTYTCDTIRDLLPFADELYFIVGADSLAYMETWKDCGWFLRNCIILAAERGEALRKEAARHREMLQKLYEADIRPLKIRPFEHSSTEIRHDIREGKDVTDLIPPETLSYIREKGLYLG
ncbi:MAG: nicotinate-nucleotide adenylyltransferase [Lachnospiraceae bacterium]|jgi:nicotinate-nucleotide adenylyltransferase|nr:nicotinate-nucleotide adenylyltransferase [Lachnospiraceae bacterium]MCH4030486.1 nicotinate-nucleotide adenylyltransferase [Lachnospiraceae bacterium]MCH4069696.1 nicotinate-nucleotide adenylyltransferase [Lachnospiraceae bacterium]MCH4107366.1 nicotinate-nucleotide adenylyltransferase [Lachnospiraceae bacterium]MCI1301780.1 nicotinate-nucleotide adenylyltransferase [Lachnospiraceae bacterium]